MMTVLSRWKMNRHQYYLCILLGLGIIFSFFQIFLGVTLKSLNDGQFVDIYPLKDSFFYRDRMQAQRQESHDSLKQSEGTSRTMKVENRNGAAIDDTAHVLPGDENCIFKDSPLYRKVYVYPSPGEFEWEYDGHEKLMTKQRNNNTQNEIEKLESIRSEFGKQFPASHRYPWQFIEERERKNEEFHFRLKDARAIQYTTELLVRDILTHPDSCLRTYDPETAALFFVPYMGSIEWHNGSQYPPNFETSPYAQAIIDILQRQEYEKWEEVWGLTSKYWKRRSHGSDHILVMSEGCHGLSHPKGCLGHVQVMIEAQQQLTPPIVIYKDTSRTYLDRYPNCAAKNIVVPAPNPDGRWFNGRVDRMANMIAQNASLHTFSKTTKESAVEAGAGLSNDPKHRPLAYYYKAGNHGSCRSLRQQLEKDFGCSSSGRLLQEKQKQKLLPKGYHFPHAFRQATFCPCPGGDTPNSKRYFDAVLAGCIPLILSEDFVWPYSNETQGTDALVQEDQFSIRLNARDFKPDTKENHEKGCPPTSSLQKRVQHRQTIQTFIESIPITEIHRLQQNLPKVAEIFSYYPRSPELPDHPLLSKTFPSGGASLALVASLSDRMYGQRWDACWKEIQYKDPYNDDTYGYKC